MLNSSIAFCNSPKYFCTDQPNNIYHYYSYIKAEQMEKHSSEIAKRNASRQVQEKLIRNE
jgi:hypothetical protein